MLCLIWALVCTVPHTYIVNKYVLSSEVTQAVVNPMESFELVELSVKYLPCSRSLCCRPKQLRNDDEANGIICMSSYNHKIVEFHYVQGANYYHLTWFQTSAVV